MCKPIEYSRTAHTKGEISTLSNRGMLNIKRSQVSCATHWLYNDLQYHRVGIRTAPQGRLAGRFSALVDSLKHFLDNTIICIFLMLIQMLRFY